MKRIICLLIMCVLLFCACSKEQNKSNSLDKIVERDLLVVGVKQDAGPFGHINEQGLHDGFDVDVAKYIAKRLVGSEKKIKFVNVTSNTRIEAVTSGAVDMVIATMSVTKSRQLLVDFSIPYYIAGQTAVVKDSSDIHNFADLKDKTTIVVLGSTSEQNLRRVIPTAKIVGYKNYKEAFQALLDGKGDAVSTDDTIISGFIAKNGGYRVLRNKLSSEPYAIAIKQTDDKILKAALDTIINQMKSDGTFARLKKKWQII